MYSNVLVNQTALIAGVTTALVVIIGSFFLNNRRKNRIPTEWKKVGKITKLFIYPLKSGRRIEVESAKCTDVGLKEVEKFDKSFRLRDRSLVIYHEENHEFRTGRTHPKMMLIEVRAQDMNYLTINAPNMRTLFVKIPTIEENKEKITISQFAKEKINVVDCGDEASNWFSTFLLEKDTGLRLGYNPATERRNIDKNYAGHLKHYKNLSSDSTGLHSDLTSMHLINEASVKDLNTRMGNNSITLHNFRPTIVVHDESLQAYEEDKWDWIKVGDVVMRNDIECARCMMTTIDPESGVRRLDREPLKTLGGYRMCHTGPQKGQPIMGIQLGVYRTGVLNVGDTVYVG